MNERRKSVLMTGRRKEPKPRAFLMFADLDGTFTPMDLEGKQEFVQCVRDISDKCNVQVKFIPVSGRPAGYVLRVLHECRDMLDGVGLKDVCDFGAAEQGAVLVDSARSYGPKYIGYEKNKGLKAQIDAILKANEYSKIISDEPDKLYTCSVHITNEAKATMSEEEQKAVYLSVRDDIWAKFGHDTLFIAMAHNCMEVMHKEISKSEALEIITARYRRQYDIVGECYCGDAENDKVALTHMSRLAEIPGVAAHVLTPANAQEAVSSDALEAWKAAHKAASSYRIRKASKRLFPGIAELIREEMAAGKLVSEGLPRWTHSFDDIFLLAYHKPSLSVL